MLTTTPRKRGRSVKSYRCSAGTEIVGLTRRKDGRWRIAAFDQTFVEPDEARAIQRFYELIGQTSNVGTVKVHANAADAARDIAHRAVDGDTARTNVAHDPTTGAYAVSDDVLSPEQWQWLAVQLGSRPAWCAMKSGVAQLAWLPEQKPKSSPRLQEVLDIYTAKPGLSRAEENRAKLFWKEFTKATGVATVGEITHEAVIRYEKKVTGEGYSPKYILHHYGKIHAILAYAIKRGCGIEDCRRALDCTAMLEVKDHTPFDPKPITPEQFWAIYTKVVEAGDDTFATVMLTALNCAMYGGEVSALKWEEINLATGELVTRRPKTSISRVAVLWPEVLAGVKKLAKLRDQVFFSVKRSYTTNTVIKLWKKYREAAELGDDLKFGQLRDAAFTIANNVSLDQARVLAGHRIGMADHYIRRAPQFVAPACQAIHDAFYKAK